MSLFDKDLVTKKLPVEKLRDDIKDVINRVVLLPEVKAEMFIYSKSKYKFSGSNTYLLKLIESNIRDMLGLNNVLTNDIIPRVHLVSAYELFDPPGCFAVTIFYVSGIVDNTSTMKTLIVDALDPIKFNENGCL